METPEVVRKLLATLQEELNNNHEWKFDGAQVLNTCTVEDVLYAILQRAGSFSTVVVELSAKVRVDPNAEGEAHNG